MIERVFPSPENCPEPYNHEVFRYCPTCSWVQEDDLPTEAEQRPETAARVLAANRAQYEQGFSDGQTKSDKADYLDGYKAAIEVVKRQADLPSLMHFDRPSDFRKGVLSCLAALEAEASK